MPVLLTAGDWIDLAQAIITGIAVVVAGLWAASRLADPPSTRTGIIIEVLDAIWVDRLKFWLRVRIKNERRGTTTLGPYFYTVRGGAEGPVIPLEQRAGQCDMVWPSEAQLEDLRSSRKGNALERTQDLELMPMSAIDRTTVVQLSPPKGAANPRAPAVMILEFIARDVVWKFSLVPPYYGRNRGLVGYHLPVVPTDPGRFQDGGGS